MVFRLVSHLRREIHGSQEGRAFNLLPFLHCHSNYLKDFKEQLNRHREGDNWWLLPTILFIFKSIQARFVDWHIANLEIGDYSLFCPDPDTFWAHEPSS